MNSFPPERGVHSLVYVYVYGSYCHLGAPLLLIAGQQTSERPVGASGLKGLRVERARRLQSDPHWPKRTLMLSQPYLYCIDMHAACMHA